MPKIPSKLKSLKAILLEAKFEDKPVRTNPSILLHGNIPKPMHGTAPRVVLGQAWWNKERQAAYASTNYCCEACGVSKWEAQYHQWLEGARGL